MKQNKNKKRISKDCEITIESITKVLGLPEEERK